MKSVSMISRFPGQTLFCGLLLITTRAFAQGFPDAPELKVERDGSLTFTECLDLQFGTPLTWTVSIPGKIYHLTLTKSQLNNFGRDDQVAITGTPVLQESEPVEEYSIKVKAIRLLHRPHTVPRPHTDTSKWRLFRQPQFGISMRYAAPQLRHRQFDFSVYGENEQSKPNFISSAGSKQLFRFNLGSLFRDALAGGELSVWVNPAIRSATLCQQFGDSDPGSESVRTFGRTRYAESDTGGILGGGRWGIDEYLHVYRNGFCFEFHFAVEGSSRGNLENQCAYNDPNESEAEELVMDSVSFFNPY